MITNNCKCPTCLRLWGKVEKVKTGTQCIMCAKGKACHLYDARVLYGFCNSFESIKKGGVICG